ncbi:hypothetical protein [Butyrivibrio sp. AE3004]|uniref:hypothetical protein n=1 Tax=Butyrivibrio sp. AE3004 TaxID=1506994 RepID=UPI000494A8AE|nr:hypothetical protein [Butyrivibrio sp. AE3004]
MSSNYKGEIIKGQKKAAFWLKQNLKYLRFLSNMRLEDLSMITGISLQTLNRLENEQDRKMPYYYYLVIRQAIETHVLSKIKYEYRSKESNMQTNIQILSLITVYVAITVCLDSPETLGYNLFNDTERDCASLYWEYLKHYIDSVTMTNTPTAKTFYNEYEKKLKATILYYLNNKDNKDLFDQFIEDVSPFISPEMYKNMELTILRKISIIPPEDKMILFSIEIILIFTILEKPKLIENELVKIVPILLNMGKKSEYFIELASEMGFVIPNDANTAIHSEIMPILDALPEIKNILYTSLEQGVLLLAKVNDWKYSQTIYAYEHMKEKWKSQESLLSFLIIKNSESVMDLIKKHGYIETQMPSCKADEESNKILTNYFHDSARELVHRLERFSKNYQLQEQRSKKSYQQLEQEVLNILDTVKNANLNSTE